MNVDDVRNAVYESLADVSETFPFHVIAVVEALDGTVTHDKWLACARILKSLMTMPGCAMKQRSRDLRMIALKVASACELMSLVSFSGEHLIAKACVSAMDMLGKRIDGPPNEIIEAMA